ncbi:mannose-6-phosphate isomerase [Kaistella flava (ex Peng et al. 2021)]|uniref:Phosphohexomutase n=1 Tax=Kaistella flava (ex Peng et al. 2021) TaxID=2038776 RepID=A0A7M2YDX7_9FLAO|nr:type I phosphomannose isomerase catalytic subunit [Kaistella flava (ex Peng et al. 2021)]QOW11854.1 mannose-6-phosphate isomerase [Kaistella flava (ex Peng et al. 2021)]
MSHSIYPLKFDPIYQYRLWGGRKLADLLSTPLPENEPIGEAWILSDRKDHANEVSEGPLQGTTLTELMKDFKYEIMGKMGDWFDQFPLLLKFLDCKEVLSVQVHPSDNQKEYIPKGDSGKTEAWVVLETSNDSRIYAGLKKGTTKENLLDSIENNSVSDCLHSFVPKKDDALFIHSGTVHTLGGTVVFEVQENSDVTFRLYDWDRTDPKTGEPRELQVEEAIDCIDYNQVDIEPVIPVKSPDFNNSEKLFDDEHFKLWRIKTQSEMTVGFKDEPAILVCTDGKGSVNYNGKEYLIDKGEVMLIPAIIGQLSLHPKQEMTLLQIAIPDKKLNYSL